MGKKLPVPLNHEMTLALRERLYKTVDNFAKEFDLDVEQLSRDLGFICANMAAVAGVLGADYKEWLDERRSTSQDPPQDQGPGSKLR